MSYSVRNVQVYVAIALKLVGTYTEGTSTLVAGDYMATWLWDTISLTSCGYYTQNLHCTAKS